MKKLLLLFAVLFMLIGCVTGKSSFPVQIKSNNEVLSSVGFVARAAATYVKLKYSSEVKLYLDLAEQAINADTDAMLEEKVQIFMNELVSKIKDPEGRVIAQAFLNSFEVDIDTSQIIFDPGARQTARDAIKMFRDVLAGV